MKSGYIYVLQNKAYGAHIVKIGLTNREPNIRAREIYSGATGVPMPFDVAIAYSVSDRVAAERRVHRRLNAYRVNRRREFFRISPSVAASTVYEICSDVNRETGALPPRPFVCQTLSRYSTGVDNVAELEKYENYESYSLIEYSQLRMSPIGTSQLTEEQTARAKTVSRIFSRVYPVTYRDWIDDFSRDWTPEREIFIWEHMAKAFLSIDQVEIAPEDLKKEAFALLLIRSMKSTNLVLQEFRLRNFTRKRAKQLLDTYELRPMPIRTTDSRTANRKFNTWLS